MNEEAVRRAKQRRKDAMPEIGKAIADYCAEHDMKNVIFLDRSARPAYQVFKKTWDATQEGKRPDIYFLSPKMMEGYGAGEEEVGLFQKEHPYLNRAKDEGTLIFDVCAKEGRTLINTTDLLKKAGFTDVRTMVTAVHDDKKQYFTPDEVLYDNHKLGCHLFGAFYDGEVGVERNDYSLLAKRSDERMGNVRRNRKELSDTIKECYQ